MLNVAVYWCWYEPLDTAAVVTARKTKHDSHTHYCKHGAYILQGTVCM